MKILRIEGVIGMEGNTGEDFNRRLMDLNLEKDEELKVIVDSQGGSVFEGYSIYSKLKALPNRITTKIEGLAASIASLIVLAGDRVEMSQVSMLMIHNASTMVQGNAKELEKNIDTLKTIDNTLVNVYKARTGKEEEEIITMLASETFIDSETALADGWVDEIVDKVAEEMTAEFKQINKTNNMGRVTQFFNENFGTKFQDEEGKNETNVEKENTEVTENVVDVDAQNNALGEPEAAEGDDPATTEDEEVMTIETLNEKVDRLIEVVDALVSANEEAVAPEEQQAKIEEQVQNNFKELLANLPKSDGFVAQAVGSMDKSTVTYESPSQRGEKKMKEISNKTRQK